MGGVISADSDLAENPLLRRISGVKSISDNDPIWNQLFSFNLKIDDNDEKLAADIDAALSEVLEALMHNSRATGNFHSLVRVFLRRAAELRDSEQCDNKIFLWQTANSLIVLRYIFCFFTQRMSEPELAAAFDRLGQPERKANEDDSDSDDDDKEASPFSSTTEEFVDVLTEILCELPVNDHTLEIHIEAVKCFLALLSAQLYRDSISPNALIFSYLLSGPCALRCVDMTRSLLRNYLQHNTEYKRVGSKKKPEGESIVLGLAASMWSMMSYVATGGSVSEDDDESGVYTNHAPPASLGGHSLLLLLSLACHPTAPLILNPIKEALKSFQNSQEVSSLAVSGSTTFRVDFSALYERLCATVRQEPPMLLLYLLLHRNAGFRNYILSRINLENLIIPVMRILFDSSCSDAKHPGPSQHHTYLALIVVLIVSEDDFFCKLIHETMVNGVDWVEPERSIGEISLGGLIALIIIRCIHRNTLRTRDRYLHTNCLAALANLSSSFKNLPSIVCQRLITLIEAMAKRHAKLVEQLRASAENAMEAAEDYEASAVNYHEDITVLEEGIRTMLEIINAAMAGGGLRNNPHLIYTLLYHRALFDLFTTHPMFQDLMSNIGVVLSHFSAKVLGEAGVEGAEVSGRKKSGAGAGASNVLAAIQKEALHWPTDRLKKFPELKFRYVEDDNTVDFFVPYIWRLVHQQGVIHFDPQRVKLFSPN